MQNLCCENEFYLHENKKIHFHIKAFVVSLTLKQRLEATWKWPLGLNIGMWYACAVKIKIQRQRTLGPYFTSVTSLLAEVSHDEAKMRERRESLSFLSFLPRVRDLC